MKLAKKSESVMPASPVSACSESSAGTVRQPFFAGPDGVEPAFGCQGAAGMIVSGYGCITYVSRRCAGKKLFSFESIFKLETLFLNQPARARRDSGLDAASDRQPRAHLLQAGARSKAFFVAKTHFFQLFLQNPFAIRYRWRIV